MRADTGNLKDFVELSRSYLPPVSFPIPFFVILISFTTRFVSLRRSIFLRLFFFYRRSFLLRQSFLLRPSYFAAIIFFLLFLLHVSSGIISWYQETVAMASQFDTQPSQPSTFTPVVRWSPQEIAIIVNWLSDRDENGSLNNLRCYQTGNKTAAARQFLKDTGLNESKPEATPQKVRDKIATMVSTYKTWRQKAETTGWGVETENHNAPLSIGNPDQGTIRAFITLKCPWFYDFEALFGSSPSVAPKFVSESGKADREQREAEDEDALGNTDDDADSPVSWSQSQRPNEKNKSLEENVDGNATTAGSDDENLSSGSAPPVTPGVSSARPASSSVVRNPAQTTSAPPKSSTRATKSHSHTKSKRKKRHVPIEIPSDSSDNNERSKKKRKKVKSVGDALVEVELYKDKRARQEFKAQQLQRDQHHEAVMQQGRERLQQGKERMLQSKERLLRLQLELSRQQSSSKNKMENDLDDDLEEDVLDDLDEI